MASQQIITHFRTLRLLFALSCGLAGTLGLNAQDVLTYHNDVARTGQYLTETVLTPANVNSASFGKIYTLAVDGKVDAQPLYVSNVTVPGKGTHNLLVVATEHDSVYTFDADSGAPIWQVSLLKSGEITSDARSCSQVTPEIGITTTPVINKEQGIIYVVAMSKTSSGTYFQRLHALNLTTGAEMLGGPVDVQATYPGTGDNSMNGMVVFDPKQYEERSALLLMNGTIYAVWTSHCDIHPYTGWLMAYNAATLQQTAVLNVTPNGSGGAMWMSGSGPAADGAGNFFVLDGNGTFGTALNGNGFPSNGNYGNAFLKISTGSGLAVADYFEMFNQQQENGADADLGSGGAMVLPDLTDGSGNVVHLAVGAGKDGNIYIVNRDSMGKFNSASNNVYQQLTGALPGGIFGSPAFFNNTIYYGHVGGSIGAYVLTNARASGPVFQTANNFGYPGATPSISANGSSNGIVWATENTNPAVLHAYNATNLQELYNSNQAANGRDHFGTGNKFIAPMIAAGKVFVGTTNGVGVFGTLGAPVPAPTFSPAPGTYLRAVTVTLADATPGALIYYTTDGSTPTTSSPQFRRPIRLTTTTTIQAIAVAGGASSPVASGTYTVVTRGGGNSEGLEPETAPSPVR